MGMNEDYKGRGRTRQAVVDKMVAKAEKRRTPRDRAYARKVDALIGHAERIATDHVGKMPPKREPLRIIAWQQAWSRAFHAAMDELASAHGLRRQSHQGAES